ncbi:hypothetical protein CTI14_55135, partial [Methylobacterium radiotolerans]
QRSVMPIAFHRVYLESAGYFMPGEPVSNEAMDVRAELNERGLAPYMFRVFVLGAFIPRFRSRSCMAPEHVR